jgi:hypothetical protein
MILAACVACIFAARPVHATDFFPDLSATVKAAQGPNEVTVPALRGCDLSTALTSLITGNDKDFSGSLDNLETTYKKVSAGLKDVISQKRYEKPIKPVSNLKLSDPALRPEFFKVGDDLLVAIQAVVDKSATIVENIKAGKGSSGDLTQLVQNNGDITQLILAFYLSVKS